MDIFPKLFPGNEELGEIIKIFDVSDCNAQLLLDSKKGRAVCWLAAPLIPR